MNRRNGKRIRMDEVTEHLLAESIALLLKYPPGADFDDPVSMLQRHLRVGYACGLALADKLEAEGIWSPLSDGKRYLARGQNL